MGKTGYTTGLGSISFGCTLSAPQWQCGVPKGSHLWPVLLNISDLGGATPVMSTGDPKLGEPANLLKHRGSWAGWRNSTRAAQPTETPSPAPGKAEPRAVFQAGHCGPGQQLCGEVSRALGDSEVHRNHLGPAAAKASSMWHNQEMEGCDDPASTQHFLDHT